MARIARIVVPGMPHHVTQRGNRRDDVFFGTADRRQYLSLLSKYLDKYQPQLLAYCLMSNHVHLILVPPDADALGRVLRDTHMTYTRHVNRRQDVSGHLWQGRYFSCPLDEYHLWSAIRYIERNPVRAGIVRRAEDYRWSSAAAHCGLRDDPLLSGELELSDHVGNWREWLREENEAIIETLRRCTRTGRPCGPPTFVKRLEKLLGRKLAKRKPGPAPKKPKKTKKRTKTKKRKTK